MSPRAAVARRARPKMVRISVALDPYTNEELRNRSRAHKVSKAAFIRAAIVGARPGGAKGEAAAAADTWWDNLSPDRRAGIHQWIAMAKRRRDELDPDQLDMLTELAAMEDQAGD